MKRVAFALSFSGMLLSSATWAASAVPPPMLERQQMWDLVAYCAIAFVMGLFLAVAVMRKRVFPRAWLQHLTTAIQDKTPLPSVPQDLPQVARALFEAIDSSQRSSQDTIQALRRSEEKYRVLTEFTTDFVWEVDRDMVFTYVSPQVEPLLGYTVEELLGTKPLELMPASEQEAFLPLYESIVAEKRPLVGMECVHIRKDGTPVAIDVYGVPMFDANGAFIGYRGVNRDISARKNTEQALEKRVAALVKPMEDDSSVRFDELFRLEDIQHLQDEFSNATGVASIITHTDGTPFTRPSNFCRLCQGIIRKTEKGCANCYKSDAALGVMNPDGPTIRVCMSGGLWDAGAAICVGGKHIANWLIGQVRDSAQSEEKIRAYARDIGADEDEAAAAFSEVTPMSREQFDRVAQMLFTMAKQLSSLAYHNVQQARYISERKKTLEELRSKEEDLRVTLNSIGDAVIATDIDGRVIRMNPVAEQLTGWTIEDAGRKPLEDVFRIVHAQTRQPAENPVKKVIETGEVVGLANHTALIARGGEEYQIADSGAPIRSDTGKIIGVVLVFRDVTQEYQLQERLRQSEKMQVIGQLAGGVAHDFNNMLGGIIASAELLRKYITPHPKAKQFYELILESAERAADLTENLLAFARKQPRASTRIDLHKTLEDMVSLLRNTLDKRITLEVQLEAESHMIVGDPSLLQNAFLNLGINAAQAMPEGGTLSITTSETELSAVYCKESSFEIEPGDYILVEVRDTGTGIPVENVPKIFEPFFTTKDIGGGTGLGLAAVLGTVQQHMGAVTVYSEEGVGTVFHVILPISHGGINCQHERLENVTGHGRILVIDDEGVMRVTAQSILEELGYTVVLAEDGRKGLQTYSADPTAFDLVVMDMVMPEMNGRDCFAALRKVDPHVRVILSSGFSREEDLHEMKENGLFGFIRKPFRSAELSQVVHDALEQGYPRVE